MAGRVSGRTAYATSGGSANIPVRCATVVPCIAPVFSSIVRHYIRAAGTESGGVATGGVLTGAGGVTAGTLT